MADYIDREEVLKHKAILYDPLNTRGCFYVVTTKSIMKIPSADVEPVARCKDCKWYGHDKLKGGFCRNPEASMWSPGLPYDELKPDDYCSRAKRKEDENNGTHQ